MARKRLSDLLREEEQKGEEKSTSALETEHTNASPEPAKPEPAKLEPAEPVVEVTGEVVAPETEPSQIRGLELRDAAALEPTPLTQAQNSPAQTQAERVALETTIQQLKEELQSLQQRVQTAQTQEATLQTQVARLQAETTAQQSQIQRLQAEVAQSEQVRTELEAAKQMILRLSQPQPQPAAAPANSATANSATASPATASPARVSPATASRAARSTPSVLPSVRAAEPELDSKPAEMIIPAKTAAAERSKLHQMALRKVLDHPTQPGSLPPMPSETKSVEKEVKLSDADVGWMD
ncbi:MAG: DUF3450 domain-containing protein [Cyanobacteria bacterium RM1_2_2]|nr:DUF3450 domain-containing protein [Cyanobacteria bacterium RM1_2_2]